MKKNLFFCYIVSIVLLMIPVTASSEVVNRIIIEGATVLFFDDIATGSPGEMSEEEMQMLGARITDEYLRKGYLLSHVDDIVYRDGVLRIHVREARIKSVRVDGAEDKEAEELARFLVPRAGIIYQYEEMEKTRIQAMRRFNLEKLVIEPQERVEGGIRLVVEVEKIEGEFYGGITLDLFYGITPYFGYYTPLGPVLLDLSVCAGIRTNELRKIEGRVYSYFGGTGDGLSYFVGARGFRTIDRWETRFLDYTSAGAEPEGGVIYRYEFLKLTGAIRQREMAGDGYPSFPGVFHETRVWGSMALLGAKREALEDRDELVLTAFGGWNNLTHGIHGGGSLEARAFLCPFSRVCILPWATVYVESSSRRFFAQYVFDMDLPGFFDNYTASRFKNIAGTAVEVEAVRGRFYIGPLIAGGIYQDEKEKWRARSGTGGRGRIIAGHLSILGCYAWDTAGRPSDGGFYLSAQGTF